MYNRRGGKTDRYLCIQIVVHCKAFNEVVNKSSYGKDNAYNEEVKLCYPTSELLFPVAPCSLNLLSI